MECLGLEQIEEFAGDGLDSHRQREFEAHVSRCDDCRRRLDEVRDNLRVAHDLRASGGERETAAAAANAVTAPHGRRGASAGSADDSQPPRDSFPGYHILREVSRGGQGVVYQAIQQSTRRKVAIKVLRERHFADASERARFEREVQILGQLKHPNIVSIYDSGHVGGNAFYVMDYISGQPLDEFVQELRDSGTKGSREAGMPSAGSAERAGARPSRTQNTKPRVDTVLRLFTKVCDAVHAAHLRGIIHRDLKPSNIRVDTGGEPHILDFGLAKLAGAPEDLCGAGDTPVMTLTGQFLGSLPWSSPEQAEGQPSKIDIRTDVYSLGVILYQLLTGKFPYDVAGNMRDVLDRILREEPRRPRVAANSAAEERELAAGSRRTGLSSVTSWFRSGGPAIDDEVETIVLKCLAKERERRYQSAGELARDIGRYLAGEPIEAKRASAGYVLRKLARRHAAVTAVLASLLVIFLSSASLAFRFYVDEAAARRRLAESADHLRVVNADMHDRLADTKSELSRLAFEQFIVVWRAGHPELARRMLGRAGELVSPAVPRAMRFILDDEITEAELLQQLAGPDEPLAHLAIAERHRAKQDPGAEAAALRRCAACEVRHWARAIAEQRIQEAPSPAR